jgi:glycosyltransferase involved in cell wall biosynthesis
VPPTILFVGSLAAHKGIDLLLEALGRLGDRDWRAVVVGDGPLRNRCGELASRLGIAERVRFEGRLADAALERAFDACSLLAFPSRVAEGFGLVGIEALARGKPVVGFAAGGAGEWLLDGISGIAAPELSSASLAQSLRTLLEDRGLRARLGSSGRRLVAERFTEKSGIGSLMEVYGDALRLRAGRRAA